MNARLTAAAALIMLLVPTGRSDVVHLQDGSVRVGTISGASETGRLSIQTLDGRVDIAEGDVLSIESAPLLRRTLDNSLGKLAEDDRKSLLLLSRWALQKGLFDDALRLADRALEGVATEELPSRVPPRLFDIPLEGIGKDGVLELAAARRLLARTGQQSGVATALVVQQRLRDLVPHHPVTDALLEGLKSRDASIRRNAVDLLALVAPPSGLLPALELTLRDPDPAVRAEAAATLRVYGYPDIDRPLIRALEQGDSRLRAAAMDAIEIIEARRAVAALVRNLRRGDGQAARSHVDNIEQRAYLSGFDVDVANSAFIANPNIGVLQSGFTVQVAVLDVTRQPLPVRERERIASLLRHLTGQEFGVDPQPWESWLADQ